MIMQSEKTSERRRLSDPEVARLRRHAASSHIEIQKLQEESEGLTLPEFLIIPHKLFISERRNNSKVTERANIEARRKKAKADKKRKHQAAVSRRKSRAA